MFRRVLVALAAMAMIAAAPPMPQQGAPAPQGQVSNAPLANVQLADPDDEARAQAIMEELRCLTCQSQSIADSDAPMAGDMRHAVRTQIAAGASGEEVRSWMVERYGDYVTYRPQLGSATWPLYIAPLLFLLIAGIILARRLRRKAE